MKLKELWWNLKWFSYYCLTQPFREIKALPAKPVIMILFLLFIIAAFKQWFDLMTVFGVFIVMMFLQHEYQEGHWKHLARRHYEKLAKNSDGRSTDGVVRDTPGVQHSTKDLDND